MDNEFLLNLKEMSIEVVAIAFLVFGLTMLIKWPIKKITARYDENKRKAINTVIVFIPMFLSFLFSVLYFGIFKSKWFDVLAFDTAASSYLLAVGIYAVFTRIVIIIKGSKSTEKDSDLSKETVKYIKNNINIISKALKIDEQKMIEIVDNMDKLLTLKEAIISNTSLQDISATENLNNQIKELNSKKMELETSIDKAKKEILAYQNSLKQGEN